MAHSPPGLAFEFPMFPFLCALCCRVDMSSDKNHEDASKWSPPPHIEKDNLDLSESDDSSEHHRVHNVGFCSNPTFLGES